VIYNEETFKKFNSLIQNKEINVLSLNTLKLPELQEIAKKLGLDGTGGKSATAIRNEINNLAKLFIAGQVSYSKCFSIEILGLSISHDLLYYTEFSMFLDQNKS
jgi:hypothetical protein